jgi:WD40 repeat protein
VAFSPDGKDLAAVSADSSVILWDVDTGKAIRTIGQRHDPFGPGSYLGTLAFSPDGKLLGIGQDNSSLIGGWWAGITLWDCVSQKQRHVLSLRDPHSIRSLAFSPDDKHWAAADDSGGVYLWNSAEGDQETRLDVTTSASYFVAFSPDGKDLILGTRADKRTFGKPGWGEVIFWELARRKVRRAFLVDREHFLEAVALSADGKSVAVLAGNRASLWDTASGEKVRDLKANADVRSLALSPDGKTIALGCWEPADRNPEMGAVSLLDAATGKERLALKGYANCLAFSLDGKRLATSRSDCTVRLWDTETGQPIAPVTGHTDAVTQVAVSVDGKTIVSAGDGGTVCLWDAAGTLKLSRQLQPGFGTYAGFGSVRITPDGEVLATPGSTPYGPSRPTRPILWDVRTGKDLLTLEPLGLGGPVCPVQVSPDGRTVAIGIENTVALWDVSTGEEWLRLRGCEGPVYTVAFTGDSKGLATYERPEMRDGQVRPPCIRFWDVQTGRQLQKIASDRMASLLALSDDGKLCATGFGSEIALWDVGRGVKLHSLRAPGPTVHALAIAPDGKTLLAGDAQGAIFIWDLKTGQPTRKLTGHRGAVRAMTFLGSNRLVSASSDTTLLIWDLDLPANDWTR